MESKGKENMNLKDVWKEQKEFNNLFRQLPKGFEEQSHITQHMVLCIMSELDEILNTIHWKHHRNIPIKSNPQQTLLECVDVFKYLITIVQAWGFTEEEFLDAFWKKSMVVRQRRSEEFIKNVDGRTAIIDIDGVLCDHNQGFIKWLQKYDCELYNSVISKVCNSSTNTYNPVSRHDFKLTPIEWQELKHQFRISGYKEFMPAYADAKEFLSEIRQKDITIVLLTSRPIDRYPNLYADTVAWLKREELPYDIIWWAYDKANHVIENISNPLFVVDDDLSLVNQYDAVNIPAYWICRKGDTIDNLFETEAFSKVRIINKLKQIPIGD
jgi:uncharacterized HAD superfamily protein